MNVVVNTHTGAVGHYTEFPFNSYCEIDGVYFGAGPSGLHRIDTGDTDAGAPIDAGLCTGLMNFKDAHQKRIENAYMTMRSTGTLTLTVSTDDGAKSPPCALTLPNNSVPGFVQRRVVVPKGMRGESWQFELTNTLGASFDFGQLGLILVASARHI